MIPSLRHWNGKNMRFSPPFLCIWVMTAHFPLVAQSVKNLPAKQETQVWFPLEKEMAIHSIILFWKIALTGEPCRLQQVRHDLVTKPSPNTTTKVIHYLTVSVSHHPSVISRGFLIIHVKMKVLASFLLPQLKPVRGRRHCTSHWWWSLETARSTSAASLREGRAERLICGDAINQEQPWATGLTWKEGLDQYQRGESWLG